MMKRCFDIVACLVAIPILFIPVLVIAVVIRLESPGPPLFRQVRVGRNGVLFTCLKLRTMHKGTLNKPTHEAGRSEITRFGVILRKTKLDEVPQLWNVVRGQMSLVGPRPCLPTQTELVSARRRLGVLALRPGITGLAQIAGVDMSDPELLARIDATYLDKQGFLEDLRIIVHTVSPSALADRVKE